MDGVGSGGMGRVQVGVRVDVIACVRLIVMSGVKLGGYDWT